MSLTMHIYSKRDESSEGWDVSEIVHDIEYTTSILGQAGKLTFTLEKDTSEDPLRISIGSLVKFWHSDKDIKKGEKGNPVFFGNVFKVGTDSNENYKVVAYDQTRYLQNHEYKTIKSEDPKTIEDIFNEICSAYELDKEIAYRKPNPNDYKVQEKIYIPKNNFVDVPAFEILAYCAAQATTYGNITINPDLFVNYEQDKMKPYFYVKSDFKKDGTAVVSLREIICDFLFDENGQRKKEFLIIGDESLLSDYNYEVDIDTETYNEFIFMYAKEKNSKDSKSNEQVNEKQDFIAFQAGTKIKNTNTVLDGKIIGDDTIPKWGKLRTVIEIKKNSSKQDLINYATAAIKYYNQPTRSMKLSAIGYDGVYAGDSFILRLNKLNIDYPVYVISATHKYNGDVHIMDLEVNTNPKMELFE